MGEHEAEQAGPTAAPDDAAPPASPSSLLQSLGPAQRAIESVIIALITSTGLYLVGSVYVEAFYGRMSIDAASLDLAPPYIALQSAHVIQSLLEYPLTLLSFYVIYRVLSARIPQLHSWYDAVHGRFGRLFLLIVNGIVIAPLVLAAFRAVFGQGLGFSSSVLGEISELMATFSAILVLYAIWLSLGPRLSLFSQVRQRRLFPIALLFALYLMDALIATARDAAADAEMLMMGLAESSIEIHFTLNDGVRTTLPESGLMLVIARHGDHYVVERQDYPPSPRPVAYIVPADAVESARTQRVHAANQGIVDLLMEFDGTPAPFKP